MTAPALRTALAIARETARYFPIMAVDLLLRSRLERVAENHPVTDDESNVAQYDRVLTTKLVVYYAFALEMIHRCRGLLGGEAIDLGCGPGHFTVLLHRLLGYPSVTGLDLAPRMVACGTEKIAREGLASHVRFGVGDATRLDGVRDDSVHLCTFLDAAHHLPDLATVSRVMREMERVTTDEGLIVVMDLARLGSRWATEQFVRTAGRDYLGRGLDRFYDDFHQSMFAAWTDAELLSAIPPDSRRTWVQLTPRAAATVQVIVGLPVGRDELFVRDTLPWDDGGLLGHHVRAEWLLFRFLLLNGKRHIRRPEWEVR